jgi:hypothetical protein
MLLFRSEEHLDRWLEETGSRRGELLTLEQLRVMADEWYGSKLDPDWRRKTPEEAQAIFDRIGLSGDFWRLR